MSADLAIAGRTVPQGYNGKTTRLVSDDGTIIEYPIGPGAAAFGHDWWSGHAVYGLAAADYCLGYLDDSTGEYVKTPSYEQIADRYSMSRTLLSSLAREGDWRGMRKAKGLELQGKVVDARISALERAYERAEDSVTELGNDILQGIQRTLSRAEASLAEMDAPDADKEKERPSHMQVMKLYSEAAKAAKDVGALMLRYETKRAADMAEDFAHRDVHISFVAGDSVQQKVMVDIPSSVQDATPIEARFEAVDG